MNPRLAGHRYSLPDDFRGYVQIYIAGVTPHGRTTRHPAAGCGGGSLIDLKGFMPSKGGWLVFDRRLKN
jgi:hypothetical protein